MSTPVAMALAGKLFLGRFLNFIEFHWYIISRQT
jgi:hypothetical protein